MLADVSQLLRNAQKWDSGTVFESGQTLTSISGAGPRSEEEP